MKQPITDYLVFISRRLRIVAVTALMVMSAKVFLIPAQASDMTDTPHSASSQIAIHQPDE